MTEMEKHYRRTEAAKYIAATYGFPCSPNTLAKIACVSSDGPRFKKAGRYPLYPKSELDKWAQAKIGPAVRSTSEIAPKGAELDEAVDVTVSLQNAFVSAMDEAAAELGLSRSAYIQVAVTAAMIKAGFLRVIKDYGDGNLDVQFQGRLTQ